MTSQDKAFIEAFDWPYQGVTDASALLEMEHGNVATEEVIAIVHEYGVGYMLSDFGITLDQYQIGMDYSKVYPRFRYADEPYFAMITDITSTMEALGYGWCFAHWYGPYGVAFCLPAIQTSTYEQVEDYPCYIDQGMMVLFQSINGIN